MRNRLRDAMVVATTTAVLAVFAVAVRSTTAQGGYQAPRLSGTKNPNLSGIWQVLNTANWDIQAHSARAALAVVRGPAGEVPAAAALALGAVGGVPGGLGVVEGNEIPYRPEALPKKKENAANVLTRDPEVKCYMPGVPRAMYMPYPFQIVQSTNRIMIAFEFATAQRVINLDKQEPPLDDTWMGYSAGRWDGDTLVVDTTNQLDQTWFDRAGNFHSDALHVVERFTPLNGQQMMYEVTIEDPQTFTRPWKMRMPLYRHTEAGAQLMEYKCVEFVEELMYGHLRKEQLVRHWDGDTMAVDITRKMPSLKKLYER